MPEQLYSVKDVCSMLGISEVALWRLRQRGEIEFRLIEKYPTFFHAFIEAYQQGRASRKFSLQGVVHSGKPLHWSTQPKKGKGELPTLAFELYVSDYRGGASSFVAVLGEIRRNEIKRYSAQSAFWKNVSSVLAEIGEDIDAATVERLRRKIAREIPLPSFGSIRVPSPLRT